MRQRPGPGVAALRVVAVGLGGIAVHQRPRIERMLHAADLVLDREQRLAAPRIDDVLEAILVLIALLGDEAALQEPPMGTGEIADIDLNVVTVVIRQRPVGLAEDQVLLRAYRGPGMEPVLVLADLDRKRTRLT